jgi:acetoin utilization protein AcuB
VFVRDCMSSPAVTITPDTSLQDALNLMHEHRFRRLPVVDEMGSLVGIVSERDLLYASPPPAPLVSGFELNHLLAELETREIMTREVITTTPDTFIEEAARLMVESKIGGLPVVGEGKEVVGVITETDVFMAFIDLYRAGHAGLYVTLKAWDRAGLTVELSKAVLGMGGDIVGLSSSYDEASGNYRLVIKGQEIEKDRVVALLASLGYHVIEVYEVQAKGNNRKEAESMASRILVPLDGSSLAEQALPCAVALARGLGAELVLLRAIWIPPDILEMLDESAVELNAIVEQLEAEANGYLGTLVQQLREAGLSSRPVVRRGPAAEAILDYAGLTDIAQIVMATHGYSGIKRWTHGSVAERVLQAARTPLLLVRVGEQDRASDWQQPARCRRILVPLDGSPVAEQILPSVVSVAQAMSGELILFQVPIAHVSSWMTGEWYLPIQGVLETAEADAEAYLRATAGRLEEQGVAVTTATGIGSVADCIVEYAEVNRVDLIAMCTHGRTGLARWTLGSVADRVLRAGSTPMLLVRAQ